MQMYAVLLQYTQYYLLWIFLIIMAISRSFIYAHWHLEKSNTNITNINPKQ